MWGTIVNSKRSVKVLPHHFECEEWDDLKDSDISDTPDEDMVSLTWLGSPGARTNFLFILSGVSLKFRVCE